MARKPYYRPRITGIYQITCTATNQFYIGKSVHIPSRWASHINSWITGTHHNHHLQALYDEYGIESLVFTILEYTSKANLSSIERKHILASKNNSLNLNIK